MVEIGPVHRHQDVLLRADLLRHPVGEAVPHVDALVAHQPVHLLDRMLGHQTPRLGQSLADHGHRQRGARHHPKRGARHHPKRGARQGIDPLGVQLMPVEFSNEPADTLKSFAR